MESPTAIRAAALARDIPVALETNGTVREARGFASKTYKIPLASAYCTFSKPSTPTPLAMASVEVRIRSICSGPSVYGGSEHAESPE